MKVKKFKFVCLVLIISLLNGILWDISTTAIYAAEETDTFDDELFYEDEDSDYDSVLEDDDEDEYETEGFVEDDETGVEEEVTEDELEEALDVLDPKEVGVTYTITSRWSGHCNVDMTLSNLTKECIENWEIKFPFEGSIENIWNAKVITCDDGSINIKNADWSQDIEVGQTVSFGMTIACADENNIEFPKECDIVKEYVEVMTEYDMDFTVYSKWDNKVNGQITIHNLGDTKIEDWKLELETNMDFKNIWGAKIKEAEDGTCTLDNMNYNANIDAKGSVSFTFIAEYPDGEEPKVSEYYLYEMGSVFDIEEHIQNELEDTDEDAEYIDEDDFEGMELEAYNTVKTFYANKMSISLKAAKGSTKKSKNPYASPKNWAKKITLKEKNHVYNVVCKSHPGLAIQSYYVYNDTLYIAQRKGNTLYINKCVKDGNKYIAEPVKYNADGNLVKGDEMRLSGFAHGQTLEFFTDTTDNDKVKMLIGGNIRKDFERSLAIVEYQKGLNKKYNKNTTIKRLTKLAYANQNKKYFGYAGRIDASLSPDGKTLCIWFATDKNKKVNDPLVIGRIQLACYNFKALLKKLGSDKSLSFKNVPKSYCYSSCEQLKKKQWIRPKGSNQGIAVSNRYVVTSKEKKIKKHKIYLSSGAEQADKPMYISMMTLTRRSETSLTSNGIYHTRLKIKCKKVKSGDNKDVKKWEIEKIRLTKGNKLRFIITPAPKDSDSTISKKLQYIYSIPASKMNSTK